MEKIASFTVDHLRLTTGLYISRVDYANGCPVTTFDIRITKPNVEPTMDTAGIHAMEHLGATYLRNNAQWKDKIIYFGPMGCRTGFYLVMVGALEPRDILDLIRDMFQFIIEWQDEIPGAAPKDCGNYLDLNLEFARYYAKKYWNEVLETPDEARFHYPE